MQAEGVQPANAPARRLGPFLLQHPIGRGASGEVWAAEYVPQGTPVAVKVLEAWRTPAPRDLEAFRNEVRSVAGLDHPNVIAILEHGVVPEGLGPGLPAGAPYLVMELAAGGSLKPWCGRMPWSELERVLLDLMGALAHAHARGVVHRDLKPGNVLLGGLRPGIKLTDFGLARLFEEPGEADEVAGTPAYMAPEQFQGNARELGPWTDLYALGCTAWAMVSGSPPFGRDSPLEARRGHLFRPLPPLELAVAAPVALEGWLHRLLEKDPLRRFRRAADAAHAFRGLGRDLLPPQIAPPAEPAEPSLTQPGSGPTRSHSPRHRTNTSSTTLTLAPAEPTLTGRFERDSASMTWMEDVAPRETTDTDTRAREAEVLRAIFDDRPPVPEDWRGEDVKGTWAQLGAVGLKIFGLRAIPLVDRSDERDHLWAELRQACAEGRPRAVALIGAAGCGKSRLAEWLCERAHELGVASVLRATHNPMGGQTEGLAGLISRAIRWNGGSHDDAQRRASAALHALGAPHSRDDAPALAAVVHGEQPGGVRFSSPKERYAAIKRFVLANCAERPVVIWLDDVAWGLDALRFAADLMADPGDVPLPVLVLLTARAESLPERPAELGEIERLLALPGASRLDIGPLAAEHRAALVRSLLGLEGELAAAVEERTAGNPLFAVQLVGDWVQRGVLEPGERGFRLVEGARIELPHDLAVVWEERIGRVLADRAVPDQGREALELAAVLGLDVDAAEWEGVCRAAGLSPPWDLVEGLLSERLARAGAEGFRGGWSFVHGMLRECLISQADQAGRLEAHHRRCAAELSARGAGDPELAERLGRHLLAGGQEASALEPLLSAARARMSGGDYPRTELLLQSRDAGLRRCGPAGYEAQQAEGEVVWIQLLVFQGRFAEAEARTLALLESTARAGLESQHRVARFYVAYLNRMRGLFDLAWADLGALDPVLREQGDQALLLRVTRERGRILLDRGDLPRAAEVLQEALVLSRADPDPDREGFALRDLSILHLRAGRFGLALQHTRQARARFTRSGNRWGIADALNMLGELDREEGRLDQAEQRYRESIERFHAIGSYDAIIPQLNLCLVLLSRGSLVELGPPLDGALSTARRIKNRRLEAFALAMGLARAGGLGDWAGWMRRWDELMPLDPANATADVDLAAAIERAAFNAVSGGATGLALDALSLAEAAWRSVSRGADADRVAAHRARLRGELSP